MLSDRAVLSDLEAFEKLMHVPLAKDAEIVPEVTVADVVVDSRVPVGATVKVSSSGLPSEAENMPEYAYIPPIAPPTVRPPTLRGPSRDQRSTGVVKR